MTVYDVIVRTTILEQNVKELIFDYLDIWEREKHRPKTITGVHYHGSVRKGDEVKRNFVSKSNN